MKYALVLCHDILKIEDSHKLTDQTRDRTDHGIYLLNKGGVNKIIMSGGCEHLYGFSIAGLMKEYAISKKVAKEDILEEDLSRETVGQLIFSKQGILKHRGIEEIVIISSDYHIPRVREEAMFVFGPGYKLIFHGIPCDEKDKRSEEQERGSLEAFRKTFEGISAGDDTSILNRLLEKHPFYIKEAKDFRERLKNIVGQN
jgi:hypothetical protein